MATNAIVAENARPGTSDWHLARPALAREIEGYAGACSIDRGEAIALYVHTHASAFTLEVFRFGWYAGDGARRVAGPIELPGTPQPMPAMDHDSGLVDCAWDVTYLLHTSTEWTGGVHLVRLTEHDSGKQSYIFFVLRDDARGAPLRVQIPVTTYRAYNNWGGKSLYHWGSSSHSRASKVSFNRPFAANSQNPAAAIGMGAGEFLTNLQPHPDRYGISNAGWDCNMVRWLEREGYDVSYCTNLDVHARVQTMFGCRAWLSIGHDEYWSATMRDRIEAARDRGTHLGFFSANTAYWQVRLEPSAASGSPDRIMVCHKKAKRDPLYATDRRRTTDKFRSDAVARPEEALLGVMYAGDPVDGDIVVRDAAHWLFAGSGLRDGDRLPGLLGYEVDCVHDVAASAATILAASPWTSIPDGTLKGDAHMTLYRATSGALVLATGTIQWAWGLDDLNAPALRAARLCPAAVCITRNFLTRALTDASTALTTPALAEDSGV